jgi:hypothetical protein
MAREGFRSLAERKEHDRREASKRDENDNGDDSGELMCADRVGVEPGFRRE